MGVREAQADAHAVRNVVGLECRAPIVEKVSPKSEIIEQDVWKGRGYSERSEGAGGE